MTNAIDGRNTGTEPIRLSKASPVLIDTNLLQIGKRSSDFNSSPESFVRAVRVLMWGYALVSASDPAGTEWCNLDAATVHIAAVEQHSRRNSTHAHVLRNKILDSEMAIRLEWSRIALSEPQLALTDIIILLSQRHGIWPLASDFRGLGRPMKKGRKGGDGFVSKGQGKGKTYGGDPWQHERQRLKRLGINVMMPEMCSLFAQGRCNMTYPH